MYFFILTLALPTLTIFNCPILSDCISGQLGKRAYNNELSINTVYLVSISVFVCTLSITTFVNNYGAPVQTYATTLE